MITNIHNCKTERKPGTPNHVYVGRQMRDIPTSPLGNPWKIGQDGDRTNVLQLYKRDLWNALNDKPSRLGPAAKTELHRLAAIPDLHLWCWCAPEPCHAQIIAAAIAWLKSN